MDLLKYQITFTQNIIKLLDWCFKHDLIVTMGEVFRTQEQAEIYAKQGKGIVNSLHCKRLAIDLNLFDLDGNYLGEPKHYKPAGEYWKSLHPDDRWGGDWTKRIDPYHFEMNPKEK
jgi:hypothetical protein